VAVLGLLFLILATGGLFLIARVGASHPVAGVVNLAHNPRTLVDATKTMGSFFSTNVTVANATDVFVWQVTVTYNASLINLISMNVVNTYFDQCIDGTTGLLKFGTVTNPCNSVTDILLYNTQFARDNTIGKTTLAYTMLNQGTPPQPQPLTCSNVPPAYTCPTILVKISWRVVATTPGFSRIHILTDTEDLAAGTGLADSSIVEILYNTQDGFFSNILGVQAPAALYTVTPTAPSVYPNATIGTSTGFDGSSSTNAVNYKWAFGDNTPIVSGTTSTTSHIYSPAVPTPSVSIAENTTTASKFHGVGLNITALDPGCFVAGTIVDWGDGTVNKLRGILSPPGVPAPLVQLAHAYSMVGSFHLNVTVTNAVAVRSVLTVNGTTPGTQSSASKMIILNPGKSFSAFITNRITSVPPIVGFTADKSTAFKGDTITLTITSSDADGVVVSTRVDWGDGTIHTLPGAATSDTHSYSNKGIYTANVTVTDDDGGTAFKSSTLTIQDKPPVAGFSWTPTSPAAGDTVTFTDSSNDPDGTVTAWTWDFGDGATSSSRNPSHTYSSSGTFTVKLNVTDNDGSTGQVSKTITINAAAPTFPLPGGPLVWTGIGVGAAVAAILLVWQLVLKKRRRPATATATKSSK